MKVLKTFNIRHYTKNTGYFRLKEKGIRLLVLKQFHGKKV